MNLDVAAHAEVVVELDLFSGRPNPEWRLTNSARDRLLQLLRAAPPTSAPASEPGLGYRGFVVRITSDGKTARVNVGDGAIDIEGARGRDAGRTIEKMLMQSMPSELASQFASVLPRLP